MPVRSQEQRAYRGRRKKEEGLSLIFVQSVQKHFLDGCDFSVKDAMRLGKKRLGRRRRTNHVH